MSAESRPDKAALIGKLKGFQRQTVEHVVRRLFDSGSSRRFLVADEVGLGKTLIARGVVAEIVDRLWDDVGRVDILYVCSNTALASENLRKIHVGGKCIEATRLTLIPKQLPNFDPKLNFISLTPGTALQVTGYGRVDERVVLFAILSEKYGTPAWLKNLLQGDVETDTWRGWHLKQLPAVDTLQTERFLQRLAAAKDLQGGLAWAEETLVRADSNLDPAERRRRYHLVGGLRRLLAFTCIDALQPDLIILDEFQRFKDLLSTDDDQRTELAELASELFHYNTPEGNRVATLLLSATPYRMYTTDEEADAGDHYADFLETLRFLCDDSNRFSSIKASLHDYRLALQRASQGDQSLIGLARDKLQAGLKEVMVRTERVDSTVERDAMVEEASVQAPVRRRDLTQYMATERLAEQLGARDMVEFWKSAPYLFNFMKGYRVKEAFDTGRHLKGVRQAFDEAAGEFLSEDQVQRYQEIDPANARLRVLAEHSLGAEQWRMLWLPPTVPYWPLAEPWRSSATFSKKLVFSAWNVVPDVVSALLSYDAERRMVGADSGLAYSELHRRQRPLLRYVVRDGRPANMTTLALSLPCLTLADRISPLAMGLAGHDVRAAVQGAVNELLTGLAQYAEGDAPDPRWHWVAPILLDRDDPTLATLLATWVSVNEGDDSDDNDQAPPEAGAKPQKGLRAHLDEAMAVLRGEMRLGAFPDGLTESLTDLALGGPAVLVARAFLSKGVSSLARRRAAALVADGFRTLFNQPPVTRMLRGESDDETFWRTTLAYAVNGNLQAVLDEQVHLLWEQSAWDDKSPDDVCERVAGTLHNAVSTKVSRVSPDMYAAGDRRIEQVSGTDAQGRPERLSLRTSFALRYGNVTGASGAVEAREEAVRTAFKSPFFPFVLVSTSVGQEGLDFHPWCHDIWHWNLPGNPVDLEQREGRVHRYKGLAIRKNVAVDAFATLRRAWSPGTDPWGVLFQEAEAKHRTTHSELVPYWVAPGPHKVRRFVPCLPFSSEVEQFRRLKRSLAIYRVVFGQPRQQELLELLEHSELTREQLEQWTVSLKPDPNRGVGYP
jgi:hypothetical protein